MFPGKGLGTFLDKRQAGPFDVWVWICPLSSNTMHHHPLPLLDPLHGLGLWALFALECAAGITSLLSRLPDNDDKHWPGACMLTLLILIYI